MLAPMRAIAFVPLLAAFSVILGGCPSRSNGSSPSPSSSAGVPSACTKFGQSCLYAPGKLGSCVMRADCTGGGCLVCQSQH